MKTIRISRQDGKDENFKAKMAMVRTQGRDGMFENSWLRWQGWDIKDDNFKVEMTTLRNQRRDVRVRTQGIDGNMRYQG